MKKVKAKKPTTTTEPTTKNKIRAFDNPYVKTMFYIAAATCLFPLKGCATLDVESLSPLIRINGNGFDPYYGNQQRLDPRYPGIGAENLPYMPQVYETISPYCGNPDVVRVGISGRNIGYDNAGVPFDGYVQFSTGPNGFTMFDLQIRFDDGAQISASGGKRGGTVSNFRATYLPPHSGRGFTTDDVNSDFGLALIAVAKTAANAGCIPVQPPPRQRHYDNYYRSPYDSQYKRGPVW